MVYERNTIASVEEERKNLLPLLERKSFILGSELCLERIKITKPHTKDSNIQTLSQRGFIRAIENASQVLPLLASVEKKNLWDTYFLWDIAQWENLKLKGEQSVIGKQNLLANHFSHLTQGLLKGIWSQGCIWDNYRNKKPQI